MKICRFHSHNTKGEPKRQRAGQTQQQARHGILDNAEIVEMLDPFDSHQRFGKKYLISEVQILAPSEPSKIVCVGRNYAEHAAELGNDVPKEPLIFLKPPSAIIAPGGSIVLPPQSSRIDYEGELAVVIGKKCACLSPAGDVAPYILGYTCLNDVTARDLQRQDVQFTRAKGFDTFCPFGPWIETDLNLSNVRVETFVNQERRQSARISEMIFSVETIVQWISHVMTLEPGDVIATGTPSGVGPLSPGDLVEVTISGIGTLRNPVRKSDQMTPST